VELCEHRENFHGIFLRLRRPFFLPPATLALVSLSEIPLLMPVNGTFFLGKFPSPRDGETILFSLFRAHRFFSYLDHRPALTPDIVFFSGRLVELFLALCRALMVSICVTIIFPP